MATSPVSRVRAIGGAQDRGRLLTDELAEVVADELGAPPERPDGLADPVVEDGAVARHAVDGVGERVDDRLEPLEGHRASIRDLHRDPRASG